MAWACNPCYRDLLYLTIVCTVYHNSLDSYSFLPFSPFLFLFLPPLLFSPDSFSPFPPFLSTSPLPLVSLYSLSCPQGTALGIIALGCLFSLAFHLLTREPNTTSEQKSETARGGKLPWYKWLTKPRFYLVRRNSCTYSDPKMRQELQKKKTFLISRLLLLYNKQPRDKKPGGAREHNTMHNWTIVTKICCHRLIYSNITGLPR